MESSVFDGIIKKVGGEVIQQQADYTGKDGFLHCGICHEAKEAYMFQDDSIPIPDLPGWDMQKKRPRNCACQRKRLEDEENALKRQQEKQQIERLRNMGLTDAQYRESSFSNDDGLNPEASRICRAYVDKFEQLRELPNGGGGLILYGAPGGGKTFMASCIANGLIEKSISVIMTTAERLSSEMTANYGENKERILRDVSSVSLLIIDDFGIERDTKTVLLNLYELINTRYKARKPMVITTNLTMDAIKEAKQTTYQRIYGRITEMCPYALKVETDKRRQNIAKAKYQLMKNIFDDTKGA